MKKLLFIFACLFQVFFAFAQNNLGIGTLTPDASALLELSATDKGFLPPRLTTAQKLAVPNPATGLLVFDVTTNSFWYFNGIIWVEALCQQNNPGTGGFLHYIGELYGGGIVVSVWKEAGYEHGLIASLTDVSSGAAWSNIATVAVGVTAQSPNDGQANTNAIIAQTGHTSSAALVCDSYSAGGFSDWYLPALWELNQCFNSAYIVTTILGPLNGFQMQGYWSSTEDFPLYNYSNTSARCVSFPKYATTANKTGLGYVRAVRRF